MRARKQTGVWLVEHRVRRKWVATAWGIDDPSEGFGKLGQARFGMRQAHAQYHGESYRIRRYVPALSKPKPAKKRASR